MEKTKVALIKGDGVGKEVLPEAKKILSTIETLTDYQFTYLEVPAGAEVWRSSGISITESSFKRLQEVDAILLGALGDPGVPQGVAENAVLKIRQGFDQYINIRPIRLYDSLREICPLKDDRIGEGIDISIIRENSEGIYRKFGGSIEGNTSVDNMIFTQKGVERIIDFAYNYAISREHTTISSVDKANLLHTSKMWRVIFEKMGEQYPKLKKESYYIDAFCQWLIRSPYMFQTVVTSNMFGDIISDEAAVLAGSLGMVPSANLNPHGISMFEPIHGSAPDIAGQNIANPIATILSVKLMLELTIKDEILARLVDNSVEEAIKTHRTVDIFPKSSTVLKKVTTQEMGTLIQTELEKRLKK
jgi:3-isopropylmalate dehydrogenase